MLIIDKIQQKYAVRKDDSEKVNTIAINGRDVIKLIEECSNQCIHPISSNEGEMLIMGMKVNLNHNLPDGLILMYNDDCVVCVVIDKVEA